MCSDDQVGARKNFTQHLGIIHQHISGRGSQKKFDPRHLVFIQLLKDFQIVIGATEHKGIVGCRGFLSAV